MADKPDPLKAARDAAVSGRRFSRGIMDSAEQIWLAGLGALSRTQQEGGKFFDTLVEEGVRIQEKTHAYAQERIDKTREQTEPWLEVARKRSSEAMGKLEQTLNARLERALKRLPLASQSDLAELAARVDALAHEVRGRRGVAVSKPRSAKKHAEPKA